MQFDNRYRLIWDIAYVLYFISFFINDIAFTSESIQLTLVKIVRYLAYLLFVIYFVFLECVKKKKIVVSLLAILFAAFCTYFTGDIYFATLAFVILSSYYIKPYHIFRVSYIVLILSTLFVVLGSVIHIFPMINSPRKNGNGARLGLGFYHSNVLPLILFYLICYKIVISKKRIHLFRIACWILAGLVVYKLCDSKNGLICCLLTVFGYLVFSKTKKGNGFFLFLAKYSIVFLSLFSIVMMLLQGTNSEFSLLLNRLMSSRLSISYSQYSRMGLHLVSLMDSNTYIDQRSVIDNGYLYIAMRYGFIYLMLYWFTHFKFAKKHYNQPLVLGILIVISLANFIDNDLQSYGYLPVVLSSYSKYALYEE